NERWFQGWAACTRRLESLPRLRMRLSQAASLVRRLPASTAQTIAEDPLQRVGVQSRPWCLALHSEKLANNRPDNWLCQYRRTHLNLRKSYAATLPSNEGEIQRRAPAETR